MPAAVSDSSQTEADPLLVAKKPKDPHLNWNNDETDKWMKNAVEAQKGYIDMNRDITYNRYTDTESVESTICISVYGNDVKPNAPLTSKILWLYNSAKRKVAQVVRKKIYSKARMELRQLDMTVVYVSVKLEEPKNQFTSLPVFCFKSKDGKISYVDQTGYYYEDWNTYLTTNGLPQCMMCYPIQGRYKGEVSDQTPVTFGFKESPECTLTRRAKAVGVQCMKIATVALPIVGILCPPLLVAGGYLRALSVLRAVQMGFAVSNLALSIGNFAYSTWDKTCQDDLTYGDVITGALSVAMSVLNLTTPLINQKIVGKAVVDKVALTALESTLITLLNTATFAMSSVTLLTTIGVLLLKEKVTASDMINLSLSIYYFTGACMRPKTAAAVYDEMKTSYQKELGIERQKQEDSKANEQKSENAADGKDPNNDGKGTENNNGPNNNEGTPNDPDKTPTKPDAADVERSRRELDEESKKITNPQAKEYFDKNIRPKENAENEFVENNNLIRMMKQLDNVNEFFCETAITETKFTFTTNGQIMMNGEIEIHPYALNDIGKNSNADRRCTLIHEMQGLAGDDPKKAELAAELGSLQESHREILMQRTHDFDARMQDLTKRLSDPDINDKDRKECEKELQQLRKDQLKGYAEFKKDDRFFFNVHCQMLKEQIQKALGIPAESVVVDGKHIFKNATPSELARFSQVIGDDEMKPAKLKALLDASTRLADEMKCNDVKQYSNYVEVVANIRSRSNLNIPYNKLEENAGKIAATYSAYKDAVSDALAKNPDSLFKGDITGIVYHVMKHPPPVAQGESPITLNGIRLNLTAGQINRYLSDMSVFSQDFPDNTRHSQDGSMINRTYITDDMFGVTGEKIDPTAPTQSHPTPKGLDPFAKTKF